MTTRAPSTAATPVTSRASWLILAVLLLFSIAAPLNQFKVPPIMPILMDDLGISVGSAGLLMSVYAVTGLLLALPAGLIYQRAGARRTGMLAGGSIIVGGVVGVLSPHVGGLLAGRVIEGIGTSFMAVLAPAIIAQWFAPQQRGTAMGIWAVWVPVGAVAMLVGGPVVAETAGWRAVWWLGAAYAVIVTVLYLMVVKASAPATPKASKVADTPVGSGATADVLRNSTIWLLALAFGSFNAAVIGMKTYLPTFLNSERNLSLAEAGVITSLISLVTIFSAPAGGVLSDRIGSRKKPYLAGFAVAVVLLPLVGALSVGWLVAAVIASGLVMGMIPTNIFAAAVEAVSDRRMGGAAMAVIMVGQNGGMLLGPIIFGALAEYAGWPVAFASLAVLSALGLCAGWLAKVPDNPLTP